MYRREVATRVSRTKRSSVRETRVTTFRLYISILLSICMHRELIERVKQSMYCLFIHLYIYIYIYIYILFSKQMTILFLNHKWLICGGATICGYSAGHKKDYNLQLYFVSFQRKTVHRFGYWKAYSTIWIRFPHMKPVQKI